MILNYLNLGLTFNTKRVLIFSFLVVLSTHPPTAFGLSSKLEIPFEASKSNLQGGDKDMSADQHLFR